jgi:hypothetical protein
LNLNQDVRISQQESKLIVLYNFSRLACPRTPC